MMVLKAYGIEGELLLLLENYLENQEQRCFGWSNI